jgi:LysR family glycine cleavage system transcriptional activator
MHRHLHLLHPLRCFESAARHRSFTRAAAELGVTQAAVSHQIRLLEAALGARLFERLARSVMPTPAGERLAEVACDSLARIDAALDQATRPEDPGTLQLAVTPGFCCRWLIPRLPAFRALEAGFELQLHQVSCLETLACAQADVAVVWSARRPPHAHARRLFGTGLTPVCAPALAHAARRLDSPSALRHFPLLHEDAFANWERWINAAGANDVPVRRGQIIDDCNALLSAAIAGEGVALGRTVLIEEDLRRGNLVAPFGLDVDAAGAYWLVANGPVGASPRFGALGDFIEDEALRQAQPGTALAIAA